MSILDEDTSNHGVATSFVGLTLTAVEGGSFNGSHAPDEYIVLVFGDRRLFISTSEWMTFSEGL